MPGHELIDDIKVISLHEGSTSPPLRYHQVGAPYCTAVTVARGKLSFPAGVSPVESTSGWVLRLVPDARGL